MSGFRFAGLLLALMAAIGGVAYLVYKNAASLECEDKVVEEVTSPEGNVTATRFEQSCGGTSAATHVQLGIANTPFKPDSRDAVYIAPGRPALRVSWTGARALLIEAPRASEAPDKPQWRNVRVTVRVIQ